MMESIIGDCGMSQKKGGGLSEDKWRGSAGALSELLKIHDVEKFGNPTSMVVF